MILKVDPMEPIMAKFAERGYDAESAFLVFDMDGDEVLTKKEIQDGLKDYNINLTPDELATLIKAIDKNTDGVVTQEEWEGILNPKVNAASEYMAIMGDIKINDPLVLEERALDLAYRSKRLEQELKVLRAQ